MRQKLISSREVEGYGPVKPDNPPCEVAGEGANSGGKFPRDEGRKRRSYSPWDAGVFCCPRIHARSPNTCTRETRSERK